MAFRNTQIHKSRTSRFQKKNTSTEDQLTFIAQSIEESYQKKSTTLAVWIDIEKAFDTVWREGLQLKLLKMGKAGKNV